MSYPTNLKKFRAWTKAMEQGATVRDPDYGKRLGAKVSRPSRRRRFARRRRKKKKLDA